MLQVENQTPFAPAIAVFPDRRGIDTLYVIVRATVSLHPRIALAPAQLPVCTADEYYEDPLNSSLKQVSDMHVGKPGTDVLLIGSAWGVKGAPTTQTDVSVSVAERRKTVRVVGDRVWRDGSPSAPAAFQSLPLVWERAFGGAHQAGERTIAEERNPIGCGFRGKRGAGELEGHPVPNLEDPAAPLRSLGDTPPPACFAPVSPAWLPRRAFAGTYDAAWQQRRAPYLPDDFDPRFLQCAAPELTFDRYLEGNEPVEIHGASSTGPIAFALPTARPIVEVRIAGAAQEPWANLETLLLEPDENRASLTWRAALPCDRQVMKVDKVIVKLRRTGGAA
ncbi:MAG TPA: DUF2169 domain-containing protein [Steroidobacteraceae bacterium]|nr:DUF2169 domain-containing protein [Steroidobacteraceae bacterium]